MQTFEKEKNLIEQKYLHNKKTPTMATTKTATATVDEYIAGFPAPVQKILKQLRATIKKQIPEADQSISYGVPTFKIKGKPVIYFAGFRNHVSVYPAPRQSDAFKKELTDYKGGKGTVQFPLDKPLPLDLITRITKFRLAQNMELEKAKTKK